MLGTFSFAQAFVNKLNLQIQAVINKLVLVANKQAGVELKLKLACFGI